MRNQQSDSLVLWAWEYADPAHPRPGEVARLEALLNTVDHHRYGAHVAKPDEERDLLAEPQRVRRWLTDHALIQGELMVTDAGAAAVRAFRDGLRAHLEQRDTGTTSSREWPSGALQLRVQREASTGELQLIASSGGVNGALEQLVGDAAVAEVRGTLRRLKICAAVDCRFAFYDHSRSRTSRWCSMQTCGNRLKTRQYRQRRR